MLASLSIYLFESEIGLKLKYCTATVSVWLSSLGWKLWPLALLVTTNRSLKREEGKILENHQDFRNFVIEEASPSVGTGWLLGDWSPPLLPPHWQPR